MGPLLEAVIFLRVTKIVAVYQTVCLVLIEDSPIEKEKNACMHLYKIIKIG